MKSNNYQCVNCQITFQLESTYIEHYKSQHHRYNIKRKLIGLPPVGFQEYHLQFDEEKTSKQSVDQDFYCEICSKKFGNSGTYKQHISSKKHKQNRQTLKSPKPLSKSSSESSFQILGTQKPSPCLFCQTEGSPTHMKQAHNFPPFQHECINYEGLVQFLQAKIANFQCVYCGTRFNSEDSVRQHMEDLGHGKLDIQDFGQYEKFYLWRIQDQGEEEQEEQEEEEDGQVLGDGHMSPEKDDESSLFAQLNHPTLQQLEQKRLSKIKLTATGAIINGKEVGYRHLRPYYKQYLNRQMINLRQKYQPSIEADNKSDWKMIAKVPAKFPKIPHAVNSR